MQYFYVNKNSVNPTLRIELILDGRYDFMKTYQYENAIQDADVTFTMRDADGNLKISKAPCTIHESEEDSCETRYIIEYKWKDRDTKNEGEFIGRFEIKFKGDLYEEGVEYPDGNLIVPIYEEIIIMVK